MVGIIVNRYTKVRHEVEIIEVMSRKDGSRYLVNEREFRGGKVWMNTFTPDHHLQQTEMVKGYNLVPVESYMTDRQPQVAALDWVA